jgi:hypothetical protein
LVGLLAAGLRWWKTLVIIGGLAVAVFAASTFALDCTDYRDIGTTLRSPPPVSHSPVVKRSPGMSRTPTVAPPPASAPLLPDSKIVAVTLPVARNLVFRMAIAYPYYLEMFDDPAERCGLEDNRIPFIPKQACFPASKVFSAMYPEITHVQGQAPAAAHVSALAELGPWFSFLVMIVSGIAIGITIRFARICEPVLAYNLTQVPLVGALTYSHGFVVFLFPVALILVAQQIWPMLSRAVLIPFSRRLALMPPDEPGKDRSARV